MKKLILILLCNIIAASPGCLEDCKMSVDIIPTLEELTYDAAPLDDEPIKIIKEPSDSKDLVTHCNTVPLYDVPLPLEIQQYTYDLCVDYNIDYRLVLAVMRQESDYRLDVVSTTNDYGVMQINKCNHEWLGNVLGLTDIMEPKQNILAGVYMLSNLVHKYDDWHKALMAYNYGEGGAAKHWKEGTYTSGYSRSVHKHYDEIERK